MEPAAMKLIVSCDSFEFARGFKYFITIQIDSQNEVRRSDISEETNQPEFVDNRFEFEVSNRDLQHKIIIKIYLAVSSEGKNEARLLGEVQIPLQNYHEMLASTQEVIREEMDILRNNQGDIIVVGKFCVSLNLLQEYPPTVPEVNSIHEEISSPKAYRPNTSHETSILDDNDGEFVWRVRLDARNAVDVNCSSSDRLPSSYIEFGWSQYSEQLPPDNEKVRSKVVASNRHPIWNQQLVYTNPSTVNHFNGFFWILLKDKEDGSILERVKLLTHAMRPFHPLHLQIKSSKGNESFHDRSSLYFSLVIEENIRGSFTDHLVEIRIKSVHWQPLPKFTTRMMIGMTTHNHSLLPPLFSTIDMKGETNLLRDMILHKDKPQSVFLSNIISISSNEASAYGKSLFVVPLSYLDSQVSFYVMVREEEELKAIPDSVVAYTEILDRELQECLFENKETVRVPTIWNDRNKSFIQVKDSVCTLEISVRNPKAVNGSDFSYSNPQRKALESKKREWELISKEVQQQQELINRLMKEYNDSTENLRDTGVKIVEFREQIQYLTKENSSLLQRLHEEQKCEKEAKVSKEVLGMYPEELRNKLLKVTQALRNERARNEEFEKVIEKAQKEVIQTVVIKSDLDKMKEKHLKALRKLQTVQSQVERGEEYRDTVLKQKKILTKLEDYMGNALKNVKTIHDSKQEINILQLETSEIKKKMKEAAHGSTPGSVDQLKQEVEELEMLAKNLRDQLNSKKSTDYEIELTEEERRKIELEVDIQKTRMRIESMESEILRNTVRFAKEISEYKAVIIEKKAKLAVI